MASVLFWKTWQAATHVGDSVNMEETRQRKNSLYVRTMSGTFVRQDSDANRARANSNSMPNFRPAAKGKTSVKDVTASMREVLESYKPHLLSRRRRLVEDCTRDLQINNDHIHVVEQKMRDAVTLGLGSETHSAASVKCYPTFVRELPDGREVGKFLSLDLGGTNFRVIFMELTPDGEFLMDSKIYTIPSDIMVGPGKDLFDHIAECLSNFLVNRGIQDETFPLGFTFSFPCEQQGLAKGVLTQWTKGFSCDGVVDTDVVLQLQKAIERRGDVKINIVAILNDTTGCLMSCAWKDKRCRIGLILGTGTNACYLEDVKNIGTIEGSNLKEGHMIVNTEWGAFGDNGELEFIRTKWDKEVDENSLNTGKQIFEKMISGMYMGELIRQVLLDLIHDQLIFVGVNHEPLLECNSFFTRFASDIESDAIGEYTRCRQALEEIGIDHENVTDEDCSTLRYVCETVLRRASMLASAGITALLKKMDYKDVVVAIDGSLFRYHPHFKNVMHSRISQMMGVDYKFDLMMSEDGSGRGAALVAAVLGQPKN